jgi:hypothetical protein
MRRRGGLGGAKAKVSDEVEQPRPLLLHLGDTMGGNVLYDIVGADA